MRDHLLDDQKGISTGTGINPERVARPHVVIAIMSWHEHATSPNIMSNYFADRVRNTTRYGKAGFPFASLKLRKRSELIPST